MAKKCRRGAPRAFAIGGRSTKSATGSTKSATGRGNAEDTFPLPSADGNRVALMLSCTLLATESRVFFCQTGLQSVQSHPFGDSRVGRLRNVGVQNARHYGSDLCRISPADAINCTGRDVVVAPPSIKSVSSMNGSARS